TGDDVSSQVQALCQKQCNQVAAIIHGELRFVFKRGVEMLVVRAVVLALDGICRNAEVAIQRCRDFILGGKGIGSAKHAVGAAIAQSDHEVGGFAGHVKTGGNAETLESLLLDEPLAYQLKHGHLLSCPFDLALASVGKADIFYITLLEFCRGHSCSPHCELCCVLGGRSYRAVPPYYGTDP